MKAFQKHIALLTLLLSSAAAQNMPGGATLQSVTAAGDGADLRLEITVSSPVKPSVETAVHPARILLDLPDTICPAKAKRVDIHTNGVRGVRTAQHSTNPLITRVVIDLDKRHPYTLKSQGNNIILIISPALASREGGEGAQPAARSGALTGIFRRKQRTWVPAPSDSSRESTESNPTPSTSVEAAASPRADKSAGAAEPLPQTTSVQPSPAPSGSPEVSGGTAGFSRSQIAESGKNSASVPDGTFPATDLPIHATQTAAGGTDRERSPISPTPVASMSSPTPAATEATTLIARTDDPSLRTVFRVKYVAEGVAYLEGGRAQGLTEGMKLVIEDTNLPAKQGYSGDPADPRVVAELVVSAVAETSAVADIHTPRRPVKVGDLAYLSNGDAAALVQQRALSSTRQYPAVISFTAGDTLDEEAREEVPRPPLPSVNRARGRIGLDYEEIISHGTTSVTSSDVGVDFRGDITRIGGTYWNLSGYWRGRLTKTSAASQQTLQDLINHTYHLSMTYDNPNSSLVAGFGRLYLPWASSLDTIDGGYFGKRLPKGTTLGIFGGSTPDPTSWNYSPDRVIGGSFINFEGGDFNAMHYSSTSGAGVSLLNWQIDRPFIFFEDSVSYGRLFSVYESAQLDDPVGNVATPSPGPGLGRSFFTVRLQPHPRIELDFNHNYFRDVPTFDPTLIGTGLLDKFLFQGFSVGARIEVLKQVWISSNMGQSNRTGDAKSSLNEMCGLTFGRLPWLALRADAHYARFNSSFGSGSYEAVTVSRQMSENLRLEVLAGQQNFNSALTTNDRARFVTGTIETTLGPHYYIQGNFTTNRGQTSYDQVMFSFGYRFDSKKGRE